MNPNKNQSFWAFLTQPPKLNKWKAIRRESMKSEISKSLDLDQEILRFSREKADIWTLRDAVRGTQIFGAIGSGKTSGSGAAISRGFLSAGMGGLVLCVKSDEGEEWEKLIKTANREKDLIRIRAGSKIGFNFLDWENTRAMSQGGGLALNLTNFFLEMLAVIDQSSSSGGDSAFWERTVRELLTNTLVIASHAARPLTIDLILKVIQCAPKSSTNRSDIKGFDAPENTAFSELCARARKNCPDTHQAELEQSVSYFYDYFAPLADKTRSIIVTSFVSMIDPILRDPLKSLFCCETSVTPEVCFEGKIIVVDMPVHTFQLVGKIANLIWKTSFKRACQQRVNPKSPVFLWIDESQYLIDKGDATFQTTARSTLCCSVFLTQNMSNMLAEIKDRSRVESLMGSLHTKIFHQNDNYETNEWASKMVSRLPVTIESKTQNQKRNWADSNHTSINKATQWEDDLPVRMFLNLKSGGPENRHVVEGIVFFSGKKFSSGKPWMIANFHQFKD